MEGILHRVPNLVEMNRVKIGQEEGGGGMIAGADNGNNPRR